MRQMEERLQQWFAMWLRGMGVLFCASLGGRRVSIGLAVKMKRAGYQKGYPDICIEEPRGQWHGMRVEVKFQTKPSPEQIKWRDELLKRNIYAVIMPHNLEYQEACDWLEKETTRYLNGAAKEGEAER